LAALDFDMGADDAAARTVASPYLLAPDTPTGRLRLLKFSRRLCNFAA
jgi:hypothetical protein